MARMHTLWIDAGMRNLPAQRLSRPVKNMEKKLILSRVKRQQIHANVTGSNQYMGEEEINIEEEMNTNRGEPSEKLDINDDETRYDSKTIQELLGESFDESYEFEGFQEGETHDPENHLIADGIKAVIMECMLENKQPPNIKNIKWKKVKIEIQNVNNVIENIKTKNLTDLNYLLNAVGIVIAERLGVKQKSENSRKSKSNKDPWWK